MLQEARRNLHDIGHPFSFAVLNVQDIPFADGSFDAVIANFMLYHVPDRPRALSEIRRVLRPAGRLYAATNGAAHMRELYSLALEDEDGLGSQLPFNLENGGDQLAAWFTHVALHRYKDGLVVTKAEPLLAYLLSMRHAADIPEEKQAALAARVHAEIAEHGAVRITKDSALFEAWSD